MLLQDKTAVIYGAGGTIGGAVAEAFAAEGARLFLAGRTRANLEAVARRIGDCGHSVSTSKGLACSTCHSRTSTGPSTMGSGAV
jgi:NAD(P)-dependent dehydrogenase (short-subunit alcohol dehydrogenase family)